MKYMNGSTVLPTVAAPRGYSVILTQRSAAIANSMMANVICQESDSVTEGRENSSLCNTPPPILDSGCSTPPPILDKYDGDELSRPVKREVTGTDTDMDAIEVLPIQTQISNGTALIETQHTDTSASKARSPVRLKDGSNSREVRRSQRITVQPHRADGPTISKGSQLADTSTDCASTSSLPPKKTKIEELSRIREGIEYQAEVEPYEDWKEPPEKLSRIREGIEYQAEVEPYEDWKEPPESCREEEEDRDVCVWRDDHGRIESKELEDFYQVTRQQFGFDVADALEVIYRNSYDMVRAMERVEELVPPKEEPLNAEEQRLFARSLSLHGKNFFRMQKMIPSRTVSSLVNYYYLTKKARCFGAISDETCPLMLKICDEEAPVINRWECDNCTLANGRNQKRKKGRYCAICDLYFSFRSQPQTPVSCHNCSFSTSHYSKIRLERKSEWSVDEELRALKGFCRFGKNFKAVAESLKTKTPDMVRRFYEDKQSVYRLEYLISSHNKLLKSEEHISDGESSNGLRVAKENGNGVENGTARRSQRAVWEPVITRMTTRHANGGATLINESTVSLTR
uniref:SANT domain-containing protein n=1 Tax=Ascaris lumbricoides TaxID=6252 RepID=A0A9J2Q1R6_ASCLU